MKLQPPTAKEPFAVLLSRPAGTIRVDRVRVLDRFDALGAAYVESIATGTPHFLPFSRLASTLPKTRERVGAFRRLLSVSPPLNAAAGSAETASGLDGSEACLI